MTIQLYNLREKYFRHISRDMNLVVLLLCISYLTADSNGHVNEMEPENNEKILLENANLRAALKSAEEKISILEVCFLFDKRHRSRIQLLIYSSELHYSNPVLVAVPLLTECLTMILSTKKKLDCYQLLF
jgi:hypothetical protein